LKSLALHVLVALALLALPTGPLRESAHPKELDVVFHRPPEPLEAPKPVPLPLSKGAIAVGPRAPRPGPASPAVPQQPTPSLGQPLVSDTPGVPEGPPTVVAETAQEKAGKSGILALKDQFASLAQEKNSTRLGAAARYGAAADVGQGSSRMYLLNSVPSGSGGIDQTALTRSVGGGGGGGAGGGGRMQGVAVGRATDSLAGIGGSGGPRALGQGGGGSADGTAGRGGPGNSRTDEEIQIVFDRYKASFYRLYNRELRNDPTLKGQMVLRLTIEPDGSVSMCVLQSTDMKAADLAVQVVNRVKTINFGAKDVQALTIVYPIDFLPAA
jgi:hypothetical protein